jgi:hypothetical protein
MISLSQELALSVLVVSTAVVVFVLSYDLGVGGNDKSKQITPIGVAICVVFGILFVLSLGSYFYLRKK